MPRAGTPRRRGAVAVSVLLGALLALLMCSGATAAGSAPGLAERGDAGAATADAVVADALVADAGTVSATAAGDAVAVSGAATAPPAVAGLQAAAAGSDTGRAVPAAAVSDQQVPGCGKSPGDSGSGPGTPPRGSPSYEVLHALYNTRADPGSWGDDALLAVLPDHGPPPLTPPSPIDLSVLRV